MDISETPAVDLKDLGDFRHRHEPSLGQVCAR